MSKMSDMVIGAQEFAENNVHLDRKTFLAEANEELGAYAALAALQEYDYIQEQM